MYDDVTVIPTRFSHTAYMSHPTASGRKDMVYPMGYTIPTKRYGIAHGPSSKLNLIRLAHCRDRLSLLLVLHNIPYLLAWYRYGIRGSDTIPYHIFPATTGKSISDLNPDR